MLNSFISFHPIQPLWENQPSFLLCQLVFLIGFILTLIHALSNKGKWPYLWSACIVNGLMIEAMCYYTPFVDNFWHSLCPIMFFGNRLPPYVVFYYANFFYTAIIFASLLNLSNFKYLAAGFLMLLLDFPYELVGVKFIQYSWHDTDPNLGDRNYWIPWSSHIFLFLYPILLATFFSDKVGTRKSILQSWKGIFFSGLLVLPTVLIIFSLVYHFLHDFYGVHTQVIALLVFITALSILFMKNFNKNIEISNSYDGSKNTILLIIYLVFHYSVFLGTTIFYNPEDQISIGLHQPIGNCNETESVYTMLGKILQRKKYLCLEDFNEDYYDFHCVPNFTTSVDEIQDFYTICGTPFENRVEYIVILCGNIVVASIVFGSVFNSAQKAIKKRVKINKIK